MVKEILSVRNLDLFSPFIFLPRVCSDCAGGRTPASQPHLYKWRPPWRPGVWGRSVWQAVPLFSLNSVQCSLASEICSWFCQKTVSPRILKKVILNANLCAHTHTHTYMGIQWESLCVWFWKRQYIYTEYLCTCPGRWRKRRWGPARQTDTPKVISQHVEHHLED